MQSIEFPTLPVSGGGGDTVALSANVSGKESCTDTMWTCISYDLFGAGIPHYKESCLTSSG